MDNNTVLNGRYQIIRSIGYGGMAEVYLAHDALLDRNVAVKRLRDQFVEDKDLLDQFRREAKSAARLEHPNIINVYDVISQEGNQYIVMEYVDGVTLKELMQEGRLSLQDALHIAVRLADGLQHAHSRHVIHCDIKPQNILVDKNMNPKIADFGIAKMVSNQTMVYSKSVMGSVHYISPEQACGEKITAASDVYSLGVVLFEMLTGQVPYTGDTAMSVAMMHVEKPIPRLSEYMDSVPNGLQAIIDKALAKKSDDRYADAGEMRRDLMALKMQLFPYANDEFAKESMTANIPMVDYSSSTADASAQDGEGATVVMKPLRQVGPTDLQQETTVIAPVSKMNNTDSAEGKGDAGVKEGTAPKKKKLNYTKLLLLITAVVVCISIIAHFVLGGDLKEVKVPEVTNKTVVEAQRLLEEQNFRIEMKEEYGDPEKYKPGTVMSQSPKAGETRKEKSLVVLTISKGAELKAVPEVVGFTYEKAEQLLMDAGFRIGKVDRKYDKSQKVGTILAQSIKGTDKAPKGSDINLVLNEGDKPVPNLVGQKLDDVKGLLTKAGLKLGEIKKVKDDSVAKDVVMATHPSAGTKLEEGAVVSVTIAEGVKPETKTGYVEFSIPGSKSVRVEIVMTDDSGKKSLYSGTQKGGVRIRQRVEYVGKASVQLLIDDRTSQTKSLN